MHAMDFYVSTCRCVMQAVPENPETWFDLYRLLPCLRQSLSCYVCFNLLYDPMGPTHNVCKHLVCRKCLGGKMKLKPACSWCKDHWDFQPNSLIRILVNCFRKLCLCIYSSHIGRIICNSPVNGETNDILRILKEVIEFQDDYVMRSHKVGQTSPPVSDRKSSGSCVQDAEPLPGCSSDDNIKQMIESSNDDVNEVLTDGSASECIVQTPTRNQKYPSEEIPAEEIKNTEQKTNGGPQQRRRRGRVVLKTPLSQPVKKNNITNMLKRKALHQKKRGRKPKPISQKRKYKESAPTDLEKIDYSQPLTKRVKHELSPPELKPPSFCKCGKSGSYNQLTCLGQRCPCYSMKLPCIGCKCRGCRNPKKRPDFKKRPTFNTAVLRSGTRTLIDSVCVSL